jgi:hypothetical protein
MRRRDPGSKRLGAAIVGSGTSGVPSITGLYHYGSNAASWGADADMMYLWGHPCRSNIFPGNLTITPADVGWYTPHMFGAAGTLRRLGVRVNASGGALCTVSIYGNLTDPPGRLWPAERLWTSGALGASVTLTPNLTLEQGSIVWLCYVWNGLGALSVAGIQKDWFSVGGLSVLAGWPYENLFDLDGSFGPVIGWKIPNAYPGEATAQLAGTGPIKVPGRYEANNPCLPTAAFSFEVAA